MVRLIPNRSEIKPTQLLSVHYQEPQKPPRLQGAMALMGAMPKTGLLKKAIRYQQKHNPVPPQECVPQMIYCIMIKWTSHSETAGWKTGYYTQDSSFDDASEWRGCFLPAVERKHWQHKQILKISPHPTGLQRVTMQHLKQIIKMADHFKLATTYTQVRKLTDERASSYESVMLLGVYTCYWDRTSDASWVKG